MSELLATIESFCEAFQLDDDLIGDAYEQVGARGRSILKNAIAAQYDVFSPDAIVRSSTSHAAFDDGLIQCNQQPVSTVVIAFSSLTAAAPLLALVVPAMTSGAPEVMCIGLCDVSGKAGGISVQMPRPEVLAGLELAGVENILSCSLEQCREFLQSLVLQQPVEQGRDILCFGLGLKAGSDLFPETMPQICFRLPRIGIFPDDFSVDLEALEYAFVGADVELWNMDEAQMGAGFSCKTGSFSDFCAVSYDGVLVGPDAQPFASTVFPVVMGPGSEGLWLYPQCHRELFLQRQYVVNF